MSKVTCKVCGNPEAEGSHNDWGDFEISCSTCHSKRLRFNLIEKFKGKFKGITYTGEVLWDKQDRQSLVNVDIQGLEGSIKVQKDSYKDAIQETEKVINQHFENSKKKDTKTFLLVRIGSEDAYEIGTYFQDLEELGEEQWICVDNDNCVMNEIEYIPGVWVEENRYYVAVELSKDLYNSPVNKELKNLPMEVLKNAQKFVAKRVKEILKKTS